MTTESNYYENFWVRGIGGWSPHDKRLDPFEATLFQRHFPRNGTILDYGCGDGTHSAPFLKSEGFNYIGIDVADSALQICRERGLEVLKFNADFSVPLSAASVDGVVCFEVLEHIFDPSTAVAEISRVLKPGCWLVGSVPNVAFLGNRLLMLLGYFNPGGSPSTSLRRPWADPHIRFFSIRTAETFLKECELRNITTCGIDFSFLDLPRLHKATGLQRVVLHAISRPFRWLGSRFPSMFSPRVYFIAQKL